MLLLIPLSVVLAYAVFQKGGVYRFDWNLCLLALGLMLLFQRPANGFRDLNAPGDHGLRRGLFANVRSYLGGAVVVALVGYVGFQLLWHSVTPAATMEQLLRLCGYIAIFLLVRGIMVNLKDKQWAAAVPLVAIAALEAVLGLMQFYSDPAGGMAHGTYVNRNHFSGLLEMAFPFAVMYPAAALKRAHARHHSPAAPAIMACIGWSFAALILVGIIHSLSRMGFVACLGSLFVMGMLALSPATRSRTRTTLFLVSTAVVLMFIFLPPDQMIERFAGMASSEEISSEARHQIWGETLNLIQAHPLFGTGLGSYESAFLKYKVVAPMFTVDFAHNDYLQLLAELGALGFGMLMILLAILMGKTAKLVAISDDPDLHFFGIAAAGALAAILLHSTADFNLYIPANAGVLAWIGGMVAGVGS